MKTFTLSEKNIPNIENFDKLIRSQVPEFDGFLIENNVVTVICKTEVTQEIIDSIEAIVPPQQTSTEAIEQIVMNAMMFGQQAMIQFAAENVLMGITQEGQTGTVLSKLSNVLAAIQTGSLYEAITRIKAIDPNEYDAKYITAARLLSLVNKIEAYLKIPLSTNL